MNTPVNIPEVMMWKYGVKVSKTADGLYIDSWEHPTIKKPSPSQLAIDIAEYDSYKKANDYKEKRKIEYPAIVDQLEAIFKYLSTIPNLPQETQAVLDSILSVKSKYPKK